MPAESVDRPDTDDWGETHIEPAVGSAAGSPNEAIVARHGMG